MSCRFQKMPKWASHVTVAIECGHSVAHGSPRRWQPKERQRWNESLRGRGCLVVALSLLGAGCSDPESSNSSSGGSTSGGGDTGGTHTSGSGGTSMLSTGGGSSGGGHTQVGGSATGGGGNPISSGGSDGTGGSDASGGSEGSGGTTTASGGGDGTGGASPIVEPNLVTSGPGAYFQVAELTPTSGPATITVDDGQVLGPWRGFGGTFNEAGWAAMEALSPEDRDRAIRLLFDKADGCGFTYGRIPIGSSDYALDRYSLNETPNDFSMDDFSIERDRRHLIPYIQAALDVQPDLHLWASPWSPPTWMKTNGAFDRGNMKEDDDTLGAHALYLARFVEEYEKEGIYVEAVHPQNEPGYLQDYPTCGWSAQLMTRYIRDFLGPLFQTRLPEREVWLGTISNPSSKSIVDTVMSDPGASSFVTGIGVQWSQDQYVAEYIDNYGVPVMQTEHRCGNFPNPQGTNTDRAPNDHAYAKESWGYIAEYIRQGVSYYLAWNMVLNTAGHNLDTSRLWAQNAPLVVDEEAGELILTPTYYVFRHVSQFVDPDSSRVAVQGGDSIAWKNPDGDIVAVMYNAGGSPAQETVSIGGDTYQVTIPGEGWATVNWQEP